MAALHDTAAAVLGQQQPQVQQQEQQQDVPEPSFAEQQQQEQLADDGSVRLLQQWVETGPTYVQNTAAAVDPSISDAAASQLQPASGAGFRSHPLELDSACGTPAGLTHTPHSTQGTGPE
jgi:hypothetical protein